MPAGGAIGLREALREGRVGARELAEAALSAIAGSDASEPRLNAFISVAGDEALAEAEEIDRSPAAHASRPLAGLPVAVKDNLCTRDLPTTCGSRLLDGYRSPYEATVVRRLRAAGALVIGKTNMDEFAMGSSTENSAYGPTGNPRAPGRVPGGSSGGSAAAVAAGLVPLALGSDTGGSVRQPAAFCGVVGLRPTYGRASRYGLVAFASSLDQVGVFGATVRDAAELFRAIAGPDPRDATAAIGRNGSPPLDRLDSIDRRDPGGARGLRVGVPREYFGSDLDAGVASACRRALDRLADAGAELREIALPHTPFALPAYHLIAAAEASSNLARFDGVRFGRRAGTEDGIRALYERSRGAGFGREVKRRILLGTHILSAGYRDEYYARAVGVRRRIAREFRQAFERVDVIFTPTTPIPAFPLRARVDEPIEMYETDAFTAPVSLAGLPAISVPIGAPDGLPVGGQLIAPPFAEPALLASARALEILAGEDADLEG